MMPSVVKANLTGSKEGSAAAAGNVHKPTALDVQRKKSQLLVSKGSSLGVKSGECSGVTSSKSSLASSRSFKLADGSQRQKVDLMMPGAAAAASTGVANVVMARNPTVRTTRVKTSSSECARPGTSHAAEKSALKTTSASGAAARVSNASKTTVHRKSVVDTSRREEISSTSVDKRKSGTDSASLSSSAKHEVSLNRSSRVPAASQTKASATMSSLATKKPQLKQTNDSLSVTGRTSVKHSKASSAAVKLAEEKREKMENDNKFVSSRISSSLCISKVSGLISAATVDGSDVKSDQVTVSNSVSISPESLPAVTISSLCNTCEIKELSSDENEASDHQSHVTCESPHCELVQSGMDPCECVLISADVTASVTCFDENGSDLEETSVCDISLNSLCLSDCSTSLFHSACSSVIGSVSDMKPPLLDDCMENDRHTTLSGSNSVSMESLHSSTGYCTPSEASNLCEVADCTLLNTEDSRYVHLFLLLTLTVFVL